MVLSIATRNPIKAVFLFVVCISVPISFLRPVMYLAILFYIDI